jgi:hypothetical protein
MSRKSLGESLELLKYSWDGADSACGAMACEPNPTATHVWGILPTCIKQSFKHIANWGETCRIISSFEISKWRSIALRLVFWTRPSCP